MIKSDLILRIREMNPHLNERECETVVKAIIGRIEDALTSGDRVEIRGFGAFSVIDLQARRGRNPHNGEPVAIAEKKAIHFKTGKEMRQRLNPHEPETPE